MGRDSPMKRCRTCGQHLPLDAQGTPERLARGRVVLPPEALL